MNTFLYEIKPYLCAVVGIGLWFFVADNTAAKFSGALLITAGVIILYLRWSNRSDVALAKKAKMQNQKKKGQPPRKR